MVCHIILHFNPFPLPLTHRSQLSAKQTILWTCNYNFTINIDTTSIFSVNYSTAMGKGMAFYDWRTNENEYHGFNEYTSGTDLGGALGAGAPSLAKK